MMEIGGGRSWVTAIEGPYSYTHLGCEMEKVP